MTANNVAPLGLALLGLVMGMRHATDPDHVIAITTIVSRERRIGAATTVGLVWGLGHAITVMAIGIAIIVFKIALPDRADSIMEFAVAVVLILLGLSVTGGFFRAAAVRTLGWSRAGSSPFVHTHEHSHAGLTHRHPHVHPHGDEEMHHSGPAALHHDHRLTAGNWVELRIRRPLATAFGVGLVHGLAGTAALALLVLGAIPQPLWGVIYLAVFGAGTMIGMVLITSAMGVPFIVAGQRMAPLHRGLTFGAGMLSLAFGLFLAYRIGIEQFLIGAKPIIH